MTAFIDMLGLIQEPGAQQPVPGADPLDNLGHLPVLTSTFSGVDDLYYLTVWICLFFFVLIVSILLWTVIKHRRKTFDQPPASTVTHHTALEVVWTVIPLIIVMVIFAMGWQGSLDMGIAPGRALNYRVDAQKWIWFFTHPGSTTATPREVWVPLGTPVKFTMRSTDVLHSLFIPSARIKRDVLPGRYQQIWFEPTRLGDYRIFCTEYCGREHSMMRATLHVVTQAEYDDQPWLGDWPEMKPEGEWTEDDRAAYITAGERVYGLCVACHTKTRQKLVGPGFAGIWGKTEKVHDGPNRSAPIIEITVNEAYVKESIREPNAKIVQGFDPGMTPFGESQFPDEYLLYFYEFLKSIKDN